MKINFTLSAVLWDMDGVLVDTAAYHYQAWQQTLAELGRPLSLAEFQHSFGMDNRHGLEYWFGRPLEAEFVQRVSDRKESLFRQAVRGKVRLLPGAAEWLDRLRTAGMRQALASSAPPENVDALVDELGIRGKFDALVSAFGMPGKPNPDVFLTAARQLDAPPERCLVIEDAVVGIQAAHAAGMRCLAVANTHPPESLLQAEWVTASLMDLPPDFFTLNR